MLLYRVNAKHTMYIDLLGGGGGGQDPQMYRQKKKKKKIMYICNLYARASEASERLRTISIFRSQNTSAYNVQSKQWYGTIKR